MIKQDKMGKITKKELSEYEAEIKKRAKSFKLELRDFHNLYDLFWMVNTPSEMKIDLIETLKLSKMDRWFYDFTARVERILFTEDFALKKVKKKTKK